MKAVNLYERALYAADGNAVSIFSLLSSLFSFYIELGKFQLAETCFQKLNLLYEKNIGAFKKEEGDDYVLSKAAILDRLGIFHYETGDYRNAIINFEEALKIFKSRLGEEFPEIDRYYDLIGTAYYFQGEQVKAEENLNKAIALGEKYGGADNPNIAIAKNILSLVLIKSEKFDLAKKTCEEAKQLLLVHSNQNKTNKYKGVLAQIYHNLGDICLRQGDMEGAEKYINLSLQVNKEVCGGDVSVEIAKNYSLFVVMFCGQSKYDEALHFSKLSSDIFMDFYAEYPQNKFLLISHFNRAKMSYLAGSVEDAKYFFGLAIDGMGIDDTHGCAEYLRESYGSLGKIFDNEGDSAKAKYYFSRWLLAMRRSYGMELPVSKDNYMRLSLLAGFYNKSGDFDNAIACMLEAVNLCKKSNQTKDLAKFNKYLGDIYVNRGQQLDECGSANLSVAEYNKAYESYSTAYRILSCDKEKNKNKLSNLKSVMDYCKVRAKFYALKSSEDIILKDKEFSSRLVKQYKKYIKIYGIPCADKYLSIRLSGDDKLEKSLRSYMKNYLNIHYPDISRDGAKLIIKVPVEMLDELAPEVRFSFLPAISGSCAITEAKSSVLPDSKLPQPSKESKQEAKSNQPPRSEGTGQELALAMLGIEKTVENVLVPLVGSAPNLESAGMLTSHWLIHAAATGDENLVRRILKIVPHLADEGDWFGNTPLMHAVNGGHALIIKLLLKPTFRINVDRCNKIGNTALMIAAERGVRTETLLALLNGNPDHELTNQGGDTALMLAEKYKHQDIVVELKKYIHLSPLSSTVPYNGYPALVSSISSSSNPAFSGGTSLPLNGSFSNSRPTADLKSMSNSIRGMLEAGQFSHNGLIREGRQMVAEIEGLLAKLPQNAGDKYDNLRLTYADKLKKFKEPNYLLSEQDKESLRLLKNELEQLQIQIYEEIIMSH